MIMAGSPYSEQEKPGINFPFVYYGRFNQLFHKYLMFCVNSWIPKKYRHEICEVPVWTD